jgi:DNA invertase Pin-like site-specific DNA recombinase
MTSPDLAAALATVESRQADVVVVVAKLDRLSRSLLDFAAIMDRARRHGWNLVAVDLGELLASVMANAARADGAEPLANGNSA